MSDGFRPLAAWQRLGCAALMAAAALAAFWLLGRAGFFMHGD